ncbi:MAG: phage portal protein [Aureliella sp.]
MSKNTRAAGFFSGARAKLAGMLGYDALNAKGHRRTPAALIQREDVELRGVKRLQLQASANDIVKNFSIAAWAIRRHLDYVARFQFQAIVPDSGLKEQIERLVEIQSRPSNFDRGGRCSREKGFRMAEARRVVDGDTGLMFLRNGSIQGIEADLIKNPEKYTDDPGWEWVDGVEIDAGGWARNYAIWGRDKGGSSKVFRRIVPASNFMLYGFFERWASEQVRGVSPLVSALNPLRDVYENLDYALIRSKLAQLFAIAITRLPDSAALETEFPKAVDDPTTADNEAASDSDGCGQNDPPPRVLDFSGGPTVFDMDPGEKIDVVESKTPSAELQNFSRLMVSIALKALDIPYSFFDEGHTNYSGARTAWLQYERACLDRRDDQVELRRRWTVFQLQRWILSGELRLPRSMSIGDIGFRWIPKGMPWWKPIEELTADLKAIGAGLSSPQEVCAKNDLGDPFEHIKATAEIIKFARDIGNDVLGEPMRLNFDPGPFVAAIMDKAQEAPTTPSAKDAPANDRQAA